MIAGCPTNSDSVRDSATKAPVRAQYGEIVFCDRMGAVWTDAGCPGSARSVWGDVEGNRALIVLRGGKQALWYDSGNLESVEMGRKPAWVNTALGVAYAIGDSKEGDDDVVLKRDLPQGEWEQVYSLTDEGYTNGNIQRIVGQSVTGQMWLVGKAQITLNYPPNAPPVTAQMYYYSVDGTSNSFSLVSTFKPHELGIWFAVINAVTNTGRLLTVDENSHLFALGPEGGIFPIESTPDDCEVQIIADVSDPQVVWVYLHPRLGGKGTGREGRRVDEGYLSAYRMGEEPVWSMRIDTANSRILASDSADRVGAKEQESSMLASMKVGTVNFRAIAGDWTNRRALLADPSSGVALVDFEQNEFNWLMRNNGEVPLFLLPGGQTWALLDEGIVRLSVDELIALKPKLAASEVLNRDDIEQVKPVAEALGWGWPDTQISPLLTYTGRMTFFDAGGMDASLAEFDWDAENRRVSRLLVAREPTTDDQLLFVMNSENLTAYLSETLLPVLGWPDVECAMDQRTQDEDELQITITLAPGERPIGKFQLWITTSATLLILDDSGSNRAEQPPVETLAEDEEPAESKATESSSEESSE